jgi:hypothetical protein
LVWAPREDLNAENYGEAGEGISSENDPGEEVVEEQKSGSAADSAISYEFMFKLSTVFG